MIFFSKAVNYRVLLKPSSHRVLPNGEFLTIEGKVAQFKGGVLDTERAGLTEEDIAILKSHPGYGYGRSFWAQEDIPPSVSMEQELARLRAENAALKRQVGKDVVVVELPTSGGDAPAENGLQKLNRLKREAKQLGIEPERDWKTDDYEQAIAAAREG